MTSMDQAEPAAISLGVTVVALDGEFDLADRQRLADAFEVAVRDPVVIVDLSRTAYMDSTALSELVKLRSYAAKLVVTQPTGSVLRLFDVAHVAGLFELRPSLKTALAELDAGDDDTKRITLVGKETHP